MDKTRFIVVTSIQDYTNAVRKYANMNRWHIIYVGDKKTPSLEKFENLTLLSTDQQLHLDYKIVEHCPYNHYSRKNIGYLYAMQRGASIIADTDDDNYPYEYWDDILDYQGLVREITNSQAANVYSLFTKEFIWPRGLPLSAVSNNVKFRLVDNYQLEKVVVWQGLVNSDPDVDAIFRLLFGPNLDVTFDFGNPVVLLQGTYSPFNSQNTFWMSEGFPLMYLPISVTFRFTDILRSYVAQCCLWAMNRKIGFTKATAYQKRNQHNLLSDFEDEIPCYLQVTRVISILKELELSGKPFEDLAICYEALAAESIVGENELSSVNAWIEDVIEITVNK